MTTNQRVSVEQLMRGGGEQQQPGAQGEPGQRNPLPRVLTVEELEAQLHAQLRPSDPIPAAAASLPKMPDVSQPPPTMRAPIVRMRKCAANFEIPPIPILRGEFTGMLNCTIVVLVVT